MSKFSQYISKDVHIAPLVVFRMVFGFVMFFSMLRFALKGWIFDQYIEPTFHFTYLGFSWVKPFGETGMYLVFALMSISFLCIAIGLFMYWLLPNFLLKNTNYLLFIILAIVILTVTGFIENLAGYWSCENDCRKQRYRKRNH